MSRQLLVLIALSAVLPSCWNWKKPYEAEPERKVLGYKPVYTTDSSILRISLDSARSVKHAGKIYVFGSLIFQNELGEGIHVLDKTNPSQVRNLGFIRIKGNSELSIKGQHLYANSYTDLVVVDVANWRQPTEIKRIKNAFKQGMTVPGGYQFIPLPERNVYFECSGIRQGYQTGWIKDSISSANCFYR